MKFGWLSKIPVLVFILSGFNAYSQKETDIINKLRAALRDGGLEIPEPSFIGKGNFHSQGVTFSGALYYHAPKSRMEMTLSGVTFIRVDNDTISWEYNPFENRHIIERKDEAEQLQEINLAKALDCITPASFLQKIQTPAQT